MDNKQYSTRELFRRFAPYFKKYRFTLWMDLFCAALTTVCELVLPLIMRYITNEGLRDLASLSVKTILSLGVLYFGLRIVDCIASYYMSDMGHVMGAKIETDMRRDAYNHLQKLSNTYYNNTKVGQIMGRITNDLFDVTEFAHHCPEEFFIAGIKTVISFIILANINLPLTLMIFLCVPLMCGVCMILNFRMRSAFRKQRNQIGELNARIEDSLLGHKVVKAFTNEEVENVKFEKDNGTFLDIKKLTYRYMAAFNTTVKLFDGLMYLQQNAIEGINGLFAYTDRLMGDEQLPSVCFNHWRTCENRVTARFASEVVLNGSMRLDDFYLAYARRLGITSPEAFAAVMKEINQLDSFSTGGLGNIGFCWTGGWRHAGLFKWMNVDNIDKAMAGYESADRQLIGLLDKTSSQSARDVLSLLENKTAATVIYLKAFKVATAIRTIDEQKMTAKDKQRVVDICNEALTVFEEYIDKYAELLPDRGSEGVIVSVWNSPMYGLKLIRQNLGGVPLEDSWHNENPVDSPPLPIRNE